MSIDELMAKPVVPSPVMAVPVTYTQAEELLLMGGSVRISQVIPGEGHGIQLIEFGGKLFHWKCCCGDRVIKFPNETMAGSDLVAELRKHSARIGAGDNPPCRKCDATMVADGMLYRCRNCGETDLRY